jgi:magnesium transporter
VGRQFDIHPLVLEDILNVHQRPKLELYEKGVFLTFKAMHYQPDTLEIQMEHVALYFNDSCCISFQEDAGDLYEGVRDRLRRASGRIRQRGHDYLAYALLDETVDKYIHDLDQMEERIESLEEIILAGDGNDGTKARIHQLRKELLRARRAIAPLREAIAQFARQEGDFINAETIPFVRDVYDHLIQILETMEQYRELLNSLHEMYLSEINFSMNKIIHVLTIVSTIFIPLSFLAGLYGMNFQYMPELEWRYGYFGLLGFMAVIVLGLLWYFRKNDWM